jgi:diguanylate cyclase (GGDEF)-like protein
MVVLPQTQGDEARNVAERIRARFPAEYSRREPDRIDTTLSIGVVSHRPKEDLSEFVKRADQAMYKAKKQGGNHSILADE